MQRNYTLYASVVLNGTNGVNQGAYLRDIAEGKAAATLRELGMLHIASTCMADSAAAWAHYTKALIGKYYLEEVNAAQANKEDKRTIARIKSDIKGVFFSHRGDTPFVPAPSQNTFFSRCIRDSLILEAYGPAFFFNGNVPFSLLGNITKKDRLMFQCARQCRLTDRYKAVLPQVQSSSQQCGVSPPGRSFASKR